VPSVRASQKMEPMSQQKRPQDSKTSGGFMSLDELRDKMGYQPQDEPQKTPTYQDFAPKFYGRENELQEIQDFLDDAESQILGVYGVSLIGKSLLVKEALNKITDRQKVTIQFRNPEEPENTFRKFLTELKEKKYDLQKNLILVIENFEEALIWTGEDGDLHSIESEFLRKGLRLLIDFKQVKLILESRFQVHDANLSISTLQNIYLQGIETEHFWESYQAEDVTREEFDQICQNFNNHTGLLALALEEVDWLYQNELHQAAEAERAENTIRLLWQMIENLMFRFPDAEVLLLCAMTLRHPIRKAQLETELQPIATFRKDTEAVHEGLFSLERKFFVQYQQRAYDINPYLQEICYTFLRRRRSREFRKIQNVPFFGNAFMPKYDPILQAHAQGRYKEFFAWVKENRKARRYDTVLKTLKKVYWENPKPEVILNEIAITYKWARKYDKAKEYLRKSLNIDPKNVRNLNELASIHRQLKEFEEAKKVLQKALEFNPKDVKILNELAILHRELKEFDEAKKVLQKLIEEHQHLPAFNELAILHRELKEFEEAKKVLQKALEVEPDNIKVLNELAILHRELKELEEAKKVLQKLIEEHQHLPAFNELAKLYLELDDFPNALQTVAQGLKIEPNNRYFPNTRRKILKAQKAYFKSIFFDLDETNYAAYFEKMDKMVTSNLKHQYQTLKNKIIEGNTTKPVIEGLKILTRDIENAQKKGNL